MIEPLASDDVRQPTVLTRSAGAVELLFFALDNPHRCATIFYVFGPNGNFEDNRGEDDEFFVAAKRLVSTHAGCRLVALAAPGTTLPRVVRSSCAALFEWSSASPSQEDGLIPILRHLLRARPWMTPPDTVPAWLASKPAVLVSDFCARVRGSENSFNLQQAEASGAIFRGRTGDEDWIVLASPYPNNNVLVHQQPSTNSRGVESVESRQFRQLARDLRDWLVASPPPKEIVLSRSGLVPFLTSEHVVTAYACNPPTAAHVRHAVEAYGSCNQLRCSSSPSRNNGAIVVRLGGFPLSPASTGGVHALSQQQSQRSGNCFAVLRTSAESNATVESVSSNSSSSSTFPDDANDLFARDKRLVDDLYAWLRQRNRHEVSCADLMPFYAAFPAYRKGGGQGSGIKHAITRFGQNRLMWLEKQMSGGDARILRLDHTAAEFHSHSTADSHSNSNSDEDPELIQHHQKPFASEDDRVVVRTVSSSPLWLDNGGGGGRNAIAPPPIAAASSATHAIGSPRPQPQRMNAQHQAQQIPIPLARRLQNAQKRVYVVVHDHEIVSGKPLEIASLPTAYKEMHGTEMDSPESLGINSIVGLLRSSPRLSAEDGLVRCDPPPPEMDFVHDLRCSVAAFTNDRPEGVTFAELKERVKLFGQERHTSVRFLRGGILGVINCVLVPTVVVQLEQNGLFYPANQAPAVPIGAEEKSSQLPDYSSTLPKHDMFGGLDANLLAGVFNSAIGDQQDDHSITPVSFYYPRVKDIL